MKMPSNSKRINVLITGANGQIGRATSKIFSDKKSINLLSLNSSQLDIRNQDALISQLKAFKPDYIINAAAYTKVDQAEKNPEQCYAINAEALIALSRLCNKHKIHLIHYSSDYVYDSITNRAIEETDPTMPKSIYAKSKLQGDHNILLNHDKYTIIRTSWVYGQGGKNFADTMIQLSKKNNSLNIVNDQIGSPTNSEDLAQATFKIIESIEREADCDAVGIFNFSSSGQTNWADYAKKIFELIDCEINVKGISTQDYGADAARPAWSVLSNEKIQKTFNVVNSPWEERLFDYIRNNY